MAIQQERITENIIRHYNTSTGGPIAYVAPVYFGTDFLGDAGVLTPFTETATNTSASAPASAMASTSGGVVNLSLSLDDEAESLREDFGDTTPFDATKDWVFEARAALTTTMLTGNDILIGLCSAHNATHDNIVYNAWFRYTGSQWVVETDDATVDLDDKLVTPQPVSATMTRFTIRKIGNEVRFYINHPVNTAQDIRVASDTRFTFSPPAAAKLQPMFKILKTGGAGTGPLAIDYVHVAFSGR